MKRIITTMVLLLCAACFLNAQNIVVTGTVRDASDGNPLIGATVQVVSTTNTTITDFDGEYSIRCSESASLRFSYAGYETKTVFVSSRTKIDIELKPHSAREVMPETENKPTEQQEEE